MTEDSPKLLRVMAEMVEAGDLSPELSAVLGKVLTTVLEPDFWGEATLVVQGGRVKSFRFLSSHSVGKLKTP